MLRLTGSDLLRTIVRVLGFEIPVRGEDMRRSAADPNGFSSFNASSNFVYCPNPPSSSVPGACAAAVPPKSKAVIAQTVQRLLNMVITSLNGGCSNFNRVIVIASAVRQDACR
jgi:hypothetical protein